MDIKGLGLGIGMLMAAGGSHAAGGLSVSEEVVLNASPAEVWQVVGRFGGLHEWHPAAQGVTLSGSGHDAGDTRIIDLGGGASITEVLVDHDNDAMAYSYVITASPLPVKGYRSELKVMADGAHSRVVWSSTFDARGAGDADARAAIAGVYTAGLGALTQRFAE